MGQISWPTPYTYIHTYIDGIGTRLEHTPRKSLQRLAEGSGVSKSSARSATQLLKLGPYKTTVIHALQLHDPASMVYFCVWFLQCC
jgi:hypothetical protein